MPARYFPPSASGLRLELHSSILMQLDSRTAGISVPIWGLQLLRGSRQFLAEPQLRHSSPSHQKFMQVDSHASKTDPYYPPQQVTYHYQKYACT
ncbi:hypothetical protein BC936DRAFT_142784 [Jimgerdemannia flammicorona]|uniref:Uncharacterized protein n=1 Tax=Jimgerdemannia flammicorona TaxID=994334 RepID=A0A433DER8_9FUNG|nr:hypothetical protein BC936DRAFT_142784 [Jimgerdemannia flammicorona]